jgi:hypothetical protein
MPKPLTIAFLQKEATAFTKAESKHAEKSLFGVTDGKAVGTYLEHKFQTALQSRYEYVRGSSAKGIDFPKLGVDIRVTSIRQPQSSCPFKSARQKTTAWVIRCLSSFMTNTMTTSCARQN